MSKSRISNQTLFIGLLILATSTIAHAQNKKESYKKLTDENVREFIQYTTDITTDKNVTLSQSETSQYLDFHIAPKARFKTSITYVVPGMPEQEKSLLLNKEDYINQVAQGAQSVEHYYTETEIESIDISKDKESAGVTTVSNESGVMLMPNPEGESTDVPIEGTSKCFQVLRLSKKGYIQMYSANCKTRMEFRP